MKPSSQKKTFGNLSLSYKPPAPSSNQIVSSKKGSFQVFSRSSDKKSVVKGTGVAPAPTPLNTPSLRAENSGKDVFTTLVPVGSNAPVWSQQNVAADMKSQDPSRTGGAVSDAPRPVPPAPKPAPWSKPVVAEPPATAQASSKPPMRNWADDDSDDEPEDLIRPSNRAPVHQSGDARAGNANAPAESQWQSRGSGGGYGRGFDEDDNRGGGYGRQQYQRDDRYSQDSRSGYQSGFGDRGGFSRYGQGAGGFRGEMRPRGNSYDGNIADGFPKRQYPGGNTSTSLGRAVGSGNGLQVAATLFGGPPVSGGTDLNQEDMGDAQEEVRALELARMEREALLHKKKQLELQQQRLLEQERERELARERQESMVAQKQHSFGSGNQLQGGGVNDLNQPPRSGLGVGSSYRDRGIEARPRHGSEGDAWGRFSSYENEDSWRRGGGLQSSGHGDFGHRDDSYGRRAPAPRESERMTSAPQGSSKIQQGSVHLLHRPLHASNEPPNNVSDGLHTSLQPHPSNPAYPHAPSEPRQLYDPKTGSYYTDDRKVKSANVNGKQRGNSHDESNHTTSNGPHKVAVKEEKHLKIKSREKRSESEDKFHSAPEESAAARKAREEAALKKEARDKEKASRPPHSKGILFRYTDEQKTVELIEQVLSAEEASKKSVETFAKSKRVEEKAESKRRKLKLLEQKKIRDLLKKENDNEASDSKQFSEVKEVKLGDTASEDSDDDRDDNSITGTAQDDKHLLKSTGSGPRIFAEPLGSAGVVLVEGSSDIFSVSESEALLDFTEVTRRRNVKIAIPASSAPSSGKKRARNERKSPSRAWSPALKKEQLPLNKDQAQKLQPAPAANPSPTPAPQVSYDLPAKPAWSAPTATIKLLVGATDDDDDAGAASPHADLKKQRREEKLLLKKTKLDKKEELKKKRKEMKIKMSHTERSKLTPDSAMKPINDQDSQDVIKEGEVKLAPSLNFSGTAGSQQELGNQSHLRRHQAAPVQDRYSRSPALKKDENKNIVHGDSSQVIDSSSAVDDIHAVADTLPRRTLSSYQIFVPGKGLTNVPVSPEAVPREVQWQAGEQHGQLINFNQGAGGHSSGHDRSSFSANMNSSSLAPNHWDTGLEQFSRFSGSSGQDWQQVPFIEGVDANALSRRGGRPNPSSSRLQSWSNNAVNPSPEVQRSAEFSPSDDQNSVRFPSQNQQQTEFYQHQVQQRAGSQRNDRDSSSYDYQFMNRGSQQNAFKANGYAKPTGEGIHHHFGQSQNSTEVLNGDFSAESQAAFARSDKIASFEDLDDQVVIHCDGILEGADGPRVHSSGRGGKNSSRGRGSPRGRGRGPVSANGRNGGFYQHPHASDVGVSTASPHEVPAGRGKGRVVEEKSSGRGRGRGEKKIISMPESSNISPKLFENPNLEKPVEGPERDTAIRGADRGFARGGRGVADRGRVSTRGGRGRGRHATGRGLGERSNENDSNNSVGRTESGRGRGRSARGGRRSRGGRDGEDRAPPAVPRPN